MSRIAAPAIAAACALCASMAAAAPADDVLAIEEVRYADLDLGTKKGRATLKWRIRMAALRVCSPNGFVVLRCYESAMANAIKQLDRKMAEHASRSTAVSAAGGVSRH